MSESIQGEARMLIDGRLVGAVSGRTFENVNPATEEAIGEVADGDLADMDAAITAARRAFDDTPWSRDHAFRKSCLEQLQRALENEKERLRLETVAEAGVPILLTYGPQGDVIIENAKWPIELLAAYQWERELPVRTSFGITSKPLVWKEAVGVVGAITPWNYPLQVNLTKVFPALAAGNTVVLKPAPETPWNATFLGRLVAEHTDMPPGVFNVVTARDRVVAGEMLVKDPRVDLVSFTGSSAAGRRVMVNGADTVKRVLLELGGKSAHIVLEDADFSAVIPGAATVCLHAGQGCAMLTRLLLPRSRYEEGIEIVRAAFEQFSYGDPLDPANLMGPLISKRQMERVLGYIEKGTREGARLVVGGGRPARLARGFYVEPTLFADVDNAMTIAREEIFGPVLVVIPYEDEADAVRIANDSPYGLSGAISSGSMEHALAVARRIRTGTLGINGGLWFGPDAPFGGYKQSGVGREMGIEGFEEFLQTKTVGLPA
jgi:aldehyde dehydrogenase (NAD+)